MSITAFTLACERYACWGVDVEAALHALTTLPVSLQCWQGDDVTGFEKRGRGGGGGGCLATGNYPGRASSPAELRSDLELAGSLIPGRLRLSLHASYACDGEKPVDRNALTVDQFRSWIDWLRGQQWGFDFNPTYFAHPLADSGMTLAHTDRGIRQFWIEHGIACRQIAAAAGQELGSPAVTNLWIPDGYKDTPADRNGPRERLVESLDAIYAVGVSREWNLDTVESKLFGIGVESYTVGSHEFYLGYAVSRGLGLCLDSGHFHPTESVADKLSAVLLFVPHLLLHVSRGVRWDSDHVVTLDEATLNLLEEAMHSPQRARLHVGLDFFDASINRIAAWVIGGRNAKRAMLRGLLAPVERLRTAEREGDFTTRLAWQEDVRSLPWGAVWDEFCDRQQVPRDGDWLSQIKLDEPQRFRNRS